MYQGVSIPAAVVSELSHEKTPDYVRGWISSPPSWLHVVNLKGPMDPGLLHFDAGEREAISVALELQAELLLMDGRDGVAFARSHELNVVGTLGVLDLAARSGLVDLQTMFDRLLETTFRMPLRLMTSILEEDKKRKRIAKIPAVSEPAR